MILFCNDDQSDADSEENEYNLYDNIYTRKNYRTEYNDFSYIQIVNIKF